MTRQMPYEPLPASVLLNEFAALKRFTAVDVGGDCGTVAMRLWLALPRLFLAAEFPEFFRYPYLLGVFHDEDAAVSEVNFWGFPSLVGALVPEF